MLSVRVRFELQQSPLFLTTHLVGLLMIKDKIRYIDINEIIEKTHFTTIKSISRLFRGSKYDKRLYYCKDIILHFNEKKNYKIYRFQYVLMLKMY